MDRTPPKHSDLSKHSSRHTSAKASKAACVSSLHMNSAARSMIAPPEGAAAAAAPSVGNSTSNVSPGAIPSGTTTWEGNDREAWDPCLPFIRRRTQEWGGTGHTKTLMALPPSGNTLHKAQTSQQHCSRQTMLLSEGTSKLAPLSVVTASNSPAATPAGNSTASSMARFFVPATAARTALWPSRPGAATKTKNRRDSL